MRKTFTPPFCWFLSLLIAIVPAIFGCGGGDSDGISTSVAVDNNTSFRALSEILLYDDDQTNKQIAIEELFDRAELDLEASLEDSIIQNLAEQEVDGNTISLREFYDIFSEKLFTIGPEINTATTFEDFLEIFNQGVQGLDPSGDVTYNWIYILAMKDGEPYDSDYVFDGNESLTPTQIFFLLCEISQYTVNAPSLIAPYMAGTLNNASATTRGIFDPGQGLNGLLLMVGSYTVAVAAAVAVAGAGVGATITAPVWVIGAVIAGSAIGTYMLVDSVLDGQGEISNVMETSINDAEYQMQHIEYSYNEPVYSQITTVNRVTLEATVTPVDVAASSIPNLSPDNENTAWILENASIDSNDVITLQAIRNRTEYAYKPINWNGNSDLSLSVDVRTTSGFSYAEYISFGILAEESINSGTYPDEPYCRLQWGYADGQSQMQAMARLEGYEPAGMNPPTNEWYTYIINYDYSGRVLTIEFVNNAGSTVWSQAYNDWSFDFSTSNRLIGFFSYGMNTDYGNPSETIEIKNLTYSMQN